MIRFLAFLALFACLLALLSIFRHRLGVRKFAACVGLLVAVFVGAFIYSALDNSKASATEQLISAYTSGARLSCSGETISNQTHNFSRATMVFMSKSDARKTPLKGCKIDK